MKKKRYVVEMDFYILADSDNDARQEAENFRKMVDKDDNQAKVHQLHEAPWGVMQARKVELFN